MQTNFMPPPGLRGAPEAQLVQMHSFLFRLTEQLNAALEATEKRIETAQATANSAQNRPGSNIIINNGGSGDGSGDTTPDFTEQYNELKALIDKTAEDVEAVRKEIKQELESSYIAKSEWGTYEENLKADFTSTAEGVVENYGYSSRLDSLEKDAVDFDAYIIETNGYIKRGIIGYDENNIPIIGIAIGQDLKSTEVIIDGVTYQEIDMTRSLATYTSDKVTFWQNGVEVAWFSNSELVTTALNVADRITLGGLWEVSRRNGFTIKWIGGEA